MRGRRANRTGRSRGLVPFVQLPHWLLDSPAWQALTATERAIYIELKRLYNGKNNGDVGLGVREAANLVHCNKDTAAAALHRLQEIGFVRVRRLGAFTVKLKLATTWVLTEYELNDAPATKDFMSWRPLENSEHGPKIGDQRSENRGPMPRPRGNVIPLRSENRGP